jgi:hypothetical protein
MFVHPMKTFDNHGTFAHDSLTPVEDITTMRQMPAFSRTSQALAHESAKKRGGKTEARMGCRTYGLCSM